MLEEPLNPIFEMQDIYQSSRKLRKSLFLNNSDFCTDYWVLWSIIKAGLLYIHYSVLSQSYYSSAMLLQPSKILINIQQNTDNIFAVLQFNIMTLWSQRTVQCFERSHVFVLWPLQYIRHLTAGLILPLFLTQAMWQTIGSLRSNVIPINPTEAIQACEGPLWYFSQWKKNLFQKIGVG